MNEHAQILLAQQGDEQAWLALVRQYQTIVFRFAWLLLDDADEADDVAQETFIRAFRSLDSFDLERPFRPWLLQIAKHLASNRRRSLRRYVAALGRWLRHQSVELDDPSQVRLSVHMLQSDALVWKKVAVEVVQKTTVYQYTAYWTSGPYLLAIKGKGINETRLIEGHVLIWEERGITYRLECNLTLEEAIKVAESLR